MVEKEKSKDVAELIVGLDCRRHVRTPGRKPVFRNQRAEEPGKRIIKRCAEKKKQGKKKHRFPGI